MPAKQPRAGEVVRSDRIYARKFLVEPNDVSSAHRTQTHFDVSVTFSAVIVAYANGNMHIRAKQW